MHLPLESYTTKSAAVKALADLGYTKHIYSGECGDGGWGSREYYAKPDFTHEEGRLDYQATASKVGHEWLLSIFS